MMLLPFPPYTQLRDARPERRVSRKRTYRLVKQYTALRDREFGVDATEVDVELLLQSIVPRTVKDRRHAQFRWAARSEFFEGMKKIRAYCDFEEGNHIKLRPLTIGVLQDPLPLLAEEYREARVDVAHECAHVLLNHREAIIKRYGNSNSNTALRAAMHIDGISGRYAPDEDLEQEADIVMLSILARIPDLDGTLSIDEIADRYKLPQEYAYLAAMTAKDFQRERAVNP